MSTNPEIKKVTKLTLDTKGLSYYNSLTSKILGFDE